MSEVSASGTAGAGTSEPNHAVAATHASASQIFREFLLIGATSFGGGVVAYLRSGLVSKRHWLSDKEFVELLSISQTRPGLNATAAIAVAVLLILLVYKINPALLVLASAVVGVLSFAPK